jgi:hypothetical protein
MQNLQLNSIPETMSLLWPRASILLDVASTSIQAHNTHVGMHARPGMAAGTYRVYVYDDLYVCMPVYLRICTRLQCVGVQGVDGQASMPLL